MASKIPDSLLNDLARGNVNAAADTFKGMLLTSAYVFNQATHAKRSDLTNEVSGAGYTAGGKTVSVSVALDTTNHKVTITAADVSWPSSTITARYLAIYKSRGGVASADELVGIVDFGADVSSTSGTLTVTASTLTLTNNS